MKNLPFHWKPRSGRSSVETGIILKADSISTLAGLLFDEPNSILYSVVLDNGNVCLAQLLSCCLLLRGIRRRTSN